MSFNTNTQRPAKIAQYRKMLQKKAVIWDPDKFMTPQKESNKREDKQPALKDKK